MERQSIDENKPLRLAIVDDSRRWVDNLSRALCPYPGMEVVFTARNGAEMQERIAETGPPDVAILDVEMPVLNGYETARWLARHHPGTRILTFSAYEDEDVVQEMLRRNVHGFLVKGMDPGIIHEAIRTVHRHGILINEHITPQMVKRIDSESRQDTYPLEETGITALRERHYRLLPYLDTDDAYKGIADKLCVSVATVKGYADELYKALGVHSRAAAVREARRLGLLPL